MVLSIINIPLRVKQGQNVHFIFSSLDILVKHLHDIISSCELFLYFRQIRHIWQSVTPSRAVVLSSRGLR